MRPPALLLRSERPWPDLRATFIVGGDMVTEDRAIEDYALAVNAPAEAQVLLDALRVALPVRSCPGTSADYCPAPHGEKCPLRDEARATIVYLTGEHELHSPGQWECVTASSSPTVVVLDNSDRPPAGHDGFAIVGAEQGTLGILAALASIVEEGAVHAWLLDRPA